MEKKPRKEKLESFKMLSPRVKQLILNEFYLLVFGESVFRFIYENKEDFFTGKKFWFSEFNFSQYWTEIREFMIFNIEYNIKTFHGYFYNDRSRTIYELFRSVELKDEIPKFYNDSIAVTLPCKRNGIRLDEERSKIYTISLSFFHFPKYLFWLRTDYSTYINHYHGSTNSLFEMLPDHKTVENIFVTNFILPLNEALISLKWLDSDFKRLKIFRFSLSFEFFKRLFEIDKKKKKVVLHCCKAFFGKKFQRNFIVEKLGIKEKKKFMNIKDLEIGNIKFVNFLINT